MQNLKMHTIDGETIYVEDMAEDLVLDIGCYNQKSNLYYNFTTVELVDEEVDDLLKLVRRIRYEVQDTCLQDGLKVSEGFERWIAQCDDIEKRGEQVSPTHEPPSNQLGGQSDTLESLPICNESALSYFQRIVQGANDADFSISGRPYPRVHNPETGRMEYVRARQDYIRQAVN